MKPPGGWHKVSARWLERTLERVEPNRVQIVQDPRLVAEVEDLASLAAAGCVRGAAYVHGKCIAETSTSSLLAAGRVEVLESFARVAGARGDHLILRHIDHALYVAFVDGDVDGARAFLEEWEANAPRSQQGDVPPEQLENHLRYLFIGAAWLWRFVFGREDEARRRLEDGMARSTGEDLPFLATTWMNVFGEEVTARGCLLRAEDEPTVHPIELAEAWIILFDDLLHARRILQRVGDAQAWMDLLGDEEAARACLQVLEQKGEWQEVARLQLDLFGDRERASVQLTQAEERLEVCGDLVQVARCWYFQLGDPVNARRALQRAAHAARSDADWSTVDELRLLLRDRGL
jgi:hypothetical protein